MLNPTWIDVDFSGFLQAILLIMLAGYILSGLRLAIFVFIDTEKRNISNKLGWSVLALVLNGLGVKFYSMLTKRPETTLSFSTYGTVFGDNTGKWNKFLTSSYGYFYIILAIISAFLLVKIIWKRQLISFLANQERGGGSDFLMGLFFAVLFAVYFFLGKRNPNKINPLDKPVFGAVKVTNQGVIDESWSKHKKLVIILAVIVSIMVLAFAVLFGYAFIKILVGV